MESCKYCKFSLQCPIHQTKQAAPDSVGAQGEEDLVVNCGHCKMKLPYDSPICREHILQHKKEWKAIRASKAREAGESSEEPDSDDSQATIPYVESSAEECLVTTPEKSKEPDTDDSQATIPYVESETASNDATKPALEFGMDDLEATTKETDLVPNSSSSRILRCKSGGHVKRFKQSFGPIQQSQTGPCTLRTKAAAKLYDDGSETSALPPETHWSSLMNKCLHCDLTLNVLDMFEHVRVLHEKEEPSTPQQLAHVRALLDERFNGNPAISEDSESDSDWEMVGRGRKSKKKLCKPRKIADENGIQLEQVQSKQIEISQNHELALQHAIKHQHKTFQEMTALVGESLGKLEPGRSKKLIFLTVCPLGGCRFVYGTSKLLAAKDGEMYAIEHLISKHPDEKEKWPLFAVDYYENKRKEPYFNRIHGLSKALVSVCIKDQPTETPPFIRCCLRQETETNNQTQNQEQTLVQDGMQHDEEDAISGPMENVAGGEPEVNENSGPMENVAEGEVEVNENSGPMENVAVSDENAPLQQPQTGGGNLMVYQPGGGTETLPSIQYLAGASGNRPLILRKSIGILVTALDGSEHFVPFMDGVIMGQINSLTYYNVGEVVQLLPVNPNDPVVVANPETE